MRCRGNALSRRGFNAAGQSIRAMEQLGRLSRLIGIPKERLGTVVLRTFDNAEEIFRRER